MSTQPTEVEEPDEDDDFVPEYDVQSEFPHGEEDERVDYAHPDEFTQGVDE
jgi:hypothetical protein